MKQTLVIAGGRELYILAIVGSPRLDGNTSYLVDQALHEAAGLGARTEKIVISQQKISPCLAHNDCASFTSCACHDDGNWVLDKFCEADGVILATPVYYYDVSAWMKTFIDRNFFLRQHGKKCRAKAVGMIVVAASTGAEDALHTLDRYVNSSSFNNIPADKRLIVCGYARRAGDIRADKDLVAKARDLGRQIVERTT